MAEAEQNVKWFDTVDGPQMLKGVDIQLAMAKNQMNDEQDELDQLKKMYKSEELTNATADIVVKRAVRQLEMSKTGRGDGRKSRRTTSHLHLSGDEA